MKLLSSNWIFLPVALLGVAGGLLWWKVYGCTDSCPVNASAKFSMLRGGLIFMAVALIFLPLNRKQESPEKETSPDQQE